MRADCGLYPRLGQFFDTAAEIADAACMTRPTLAKTLQGRREFTENEKRAIYSKILLGEFVKRLKGQENKVEALINSDFDTEFHVKE